jgi:hypothetical protein
MATPLLAALTAGCAEPPMKPIPDAIRQSITTVSADVSGVKDSDTSRLGARGSEEGSRLGAQQAYAAVQRSTGGGSLLGLLVIGPIGAAVGSARGSSEAQSVEIADATRSNLRSAIQETDFTEALRQQLAVSTGGGPVRIASATSGAASAPAVADGGVPVGHVIALEYRLNIYGKELVNPQIGIHVNVSAQVLSPDRKQFIHRATWVYCGDRYHWVQMGANNGAALRAEMNKAAAVLAEAIPYDLYVSRQPRRLTVNNVCMDFSDLPSRTGQSPTVIRLDVPPAQAPRAPVPAPQASTPAPASAQIGTTPTRVASAGPSVGAVDGTWQLEMQISNGYGNVTNAECPHRHAASIRFTHGTAEGPWGQLRVTGDGEIGGWMRLKTPIPSGADVLANFSGHVESGSMEGTFSGRCNGSFTMSRQ